MSTLSIINNFTMTSQGLEHSGKQGAASDGFSTAEDITVTGTIHKMVGSLLTATVITVWDDDNDFPIDFDYLYLWADQDVYLQIIGSGSNAIFKIESEQPFVLPGFDTILAAADTTLITGGAEPSLTDIDSIVLGNYSGNTVNYVLAIID